MRKTPLLFGFLLAGLFAGLLSGCVPASQTTPVSAKDQPATSPTGVSHNGAADPDYATVFPQDSVNRIDITLSPQAWADLQAELNAQFGGQSANNRGPAQGDAQPRPGQANPPGIGGGFDLGDTSYVPSTVTFQGETWANVGFRYSGNSTLRNSVRSGTKKISFRLDFDEYEDEDPTTTDQRFFGFKQIAFKSSAMDSSYLREKLAADIFREAGVAASQTAFYAVYIDTGAGAQYFGLYTAVEIVDDTLIETQFADDAGNVYKPEGNGAAFLEGTFNPDSFAKQTNADEADWSDIEAVFTALHSEKRTGDPAAWRADLESVFNVDAFLRWLAVDTILQNWDTYGSMAHNYYLYTDPGNGLVTWIPWDNNEAFKDRASGRGRGTRRLDQTSVGEQWPLIRYLMDDPTYAAKYHQFLEETIQGAWQPEKLAAAYQKYHDLIAPYVEEEEPGYTQISSIESFNQAVNELIRHAQERYDAVKEYLDEK